MISVSAQYAVRAALHIACHGSCVTADDLAEATAIPRGYLAKVLGQLTRAGVLTSQRGMQGGFALAREPQLITALELVRAIDGPVTFSLCRSCRAGDPAADCAAARLFATIDAQAEAQLTTATVADMLAGCAG